MAALDKPRPYRLLLKGEIQPMVLSEEKFQYIHRWMHNAANTEVFDLKNDAGRYVATIRKSDVARLYSVVKKDTETDALYYYCGYGELHAESEPCTCAEMYQGMPYHIFQRTLKRAGFTIHIDGFSGNQFTNCTKEMKEYILKGIVEHNYKYAPMSKEEIIEKYNILKKF